MQAVTRPNEYAKEYKKEKRHRHLPCDVWEGIKNLSLRFIRQMEELKNMRTIKSLLLLVLQGFVFYTNAQSTAPCLEIDSIQTEYAINDVVSFNFRNNCDEKVLISVSLEKKVNDKWLLFAEDIFQIPSIRKVENVMILKENESDRKEKWEIKRTMFREGCDNTYRFRYNIRKLYQALISTVYILMFFMLLVWTGSALFRRSLGKNK